MSTSFGALCADFYVNQKISLKMDLPSGRETVMDMFDRLRRELPMLEGFRRYEGELALESADGTAQYNWVALRKTTIRSGWVNPESLEQAYRLHRLILETAPYFLSISPLDVDFVELLFGFDLHAERNRNEVVFEALLGDSPLASVVNAANEPVVEAQPYFGFALNDACDLQAFIEVKTRGKASEVAAGRFEDQPISVYLTVRQYGGLRKVEDFTEAFNTLSGHIERLAEERVVPHVLMPIRETIMSSPG